MSHVALSLYDDAANGPGGQGDGHGRQGVCVCGGGSVCCAVLITQRYCYSCRKSHCFKSQLAVLSYTCPALLSGNDKGGYWPGETARYIVSWQQNH